jgi:3-oxoacyl-[acyl-carrier protein] reductase
MPASLVGPVALVTGASRGIGRAIALRLAARGCRVAVHYHRQRTAADTLRDALPGTGHTTFAADLGVPDDIDRLWRAMEDTFGGADVVINNAGVYFDHAPLSTDSVAWREAWQRTLAANLLGPAHLCHLAGQAMAARGGGRIVNISSRGAFRGEPRAPAYGASKAGLNSLSQSLARALAPHGVYVFCLAPGWVETDMATGYLTGPRGPQILGEHPLGRVATPDEVASAAVYCALDAPPAMTGCIIDVNGASYLRS